MELIKRTALLLLVCLMTGCNKSKPLTFEFITDCDQYKDLVHENYKGGDTCCRKTFPYREFYFIVDNFSWNQIKTQKDLENFIHITDSVVKAHVTVNMVNKYSEIIFRFIKKTNCVEKYKFRIRGSDTFESYCGEKVCIINYFVITKVPNKQYTSTIENVSAYIPNSINDIVFPKKYENRTIYQFFGFYPQYKLDTKK